MLSMIIAYTPIKIMLFKTTKRSQHVDPVVQEWQIQNFKKNNFAWHLLFKNKINLFPLSYTFCPENDE